jgi:hypothetical protein
MSLQRGVYFGDHFSEFSGQSAAPADEDGEEEQDWSRLHATPSQEGAGYYSPHYMLSANGLIFDMLQPIWEKVEWFGEIAKRSAADDDGGTVGNNSIITFKHQRLGSSSHASLPPASIEIDTSTARPMTAQVIQGVSL